MNKSEIKYDQYIKIRKLLSLINYANSIYNIDTYDSNISG